MAELAMGTQLTLGARGPLANDSSRNSTYDLKWLHI
ncbi:hypothetical protein NOCA1130134 [metagenome]|uniref:Uncharacterized protein n=1 Tax=metagenome TaxID=256318 RepID=A0A2P2C9T4_9ZZZZ